MRCGCHGIWESMITCRPNGSMTDGDLLQNLTLYSMSTACTQLSSVHVTILPIDQSSTDVPQA